MYEDDKKCLCQSPTCKSHNHGYCEKKGKIIIGSAECRDFESKENERK